MFLFCFIQNVKHLNYLCPIVYLFRLSPCNMSKKNKLARFAENKTFPHLFQVSWEQISNGPFTMRGQWREQFFRNNHPIVLELGCGKGEYTVGLAQASPDFNYIGIDIKGARLWRGCKTIQEQNITNAAFIRTKIQHLEHFFAKDEVQEIWITFPDPQPRSSKENKRLTSPVFLSRYRNILSENGIIHLKTDDTALYEYSLEVFENENIRVLENYSDLYNSDCCGKAVEISTFYEKIWRSQGAAIKYIRGQFAGSNG